MSAVFSVEVWKYVVVFCCVGLRGGGGVVCGKQNIMILENVLAAGGNLEAKNKLRGQGRVEDRGGSRGNTQLFLLSPLLVVVWFRCGLSGHF